MLLLDERPINVLPILKTLYPGFYDQDGTPQYISGAHASSEELYGDEVACVDKCGRCCTCTQPRSGQCKYCRESWQVRCDRHWERTEENKYHLNALLGFCKLDRLKMD